MPTADSPLKSVVPRSVPVARRIPEPDSRTNVQPVPAPMVSSPPNSPPNSPPAPPPQPVPSAAVDNDFAEARLGSFWQEYVSFFSSSGVHLAGMFLAALLFPAVVIPPVTVALVATPAKVEEEIVEDLEMAVIDQPVAELDQTESAALENHANLAELQALVPPTTEVTSADPGEVDFGDFGVEIAPADDISGFVPGNGNRGRNGAGGRGGGPSGAELGMFSQRLRREGAKTGDVQFSLAWNNFNDIDLHVITPAGDQIFYGARASRCRGLLDVDMNAGGRQSREPVENIFWARGDAPLGKFTVFVNHFAQHGDPDPTEYVVLVNIDGEVQTFRGVISHGQAPHKIGEFVRKPAPPPPSPNDPFPLLH